jgi:hypothetical protein
VYAFIVRYPDKMQALVDYAAAVGAARLTDGQGRVVTAGGDLLGGLLGEDAQPAEYELKVGSYTLSLYPAPGMLPLAIAKRIDGSRRLLRLLPVLSPGLPPRGGAGGGGPAHAELRVWPPSKRAR